MRHSVLPRMIQRSWLSVIVLGLALALPLGAIAAEAESKKFTLISVIFDGTKVWLPSTLIVHEGDQVGLTLINKLDAPHGFKIESLGIDAVLQPLAKTTMWFTASKVGVHPFICHLHPPHIGGQIMVLAK